MRVPEEESLMMSEWPKYKEEWNFAQDEFVMERVKAVTRGIRKHPCGDGRSNNRKTKNVFIVSEKRRTDKAIEGFKQSVMPLMLASDIIVRHKEGIEDNAVSICSS